jgi:all-trans-retinol 13,14-reductase
VAVAVREEKDDHRRMDQASGADDAATGGKSRFYTSERVDGPFDVIVIGSGASGLTSAAMLSEAGKRVLVLEQHFQPGGFTHTFKRKNYEWDVGIHYVGKAPHTSSWYLVLAGLTNGAIKLAPFERYMDELHFPDFSILVPNDYGGYEAALAARFPDEKDGIREYFDRIRYLRKKLQLYFGMNLLPGPLTRVARKTIVRKAHALATSTTEKIMSSCIADERLKAVLDAQWGNIGAPRQHCSFLVHAAMLGNYLETGAEYPVGGSGVFARELGRVICRNGSAIRVKAPVERLLIDDNTVRGVVLESGEEIGSRMVISSTGVFNTYCGLLKGQESCAEAITEIEGMKPAYEYLNLFIGFHRSPTEFGLGNGNTWIHTKWSTSSDEPTWDVTDLVADPVPGVIFFSSSCLRDPDIVNRKHSGFNGQMVTAVKSGSFDEWKGSRWGHRAEEYTRLKDGICDAMMSVLDGKYPGIKDNVDVMELGTTLTYSHFMASHDGIPFGLAPAPSRYESLRLRPTTPVKNLFLCGQDLIMTGVPAAVGSANLCCSYILRKNAGSHWARKGRMLESV